MGKWHTLSGRFNDDEIGLIRKYQKIEDLTDNELIRNSVSVMIGLMAKIEAFKNPDLRVLKSFVEEVKKEIESPHHQKAMQKASERWIKKYKGQQIQKLETEFSEIQKELEVFQQKRTRGRPKNKGAIGRPRDLGNTDS